MDGEGLAVRADRDGLDHLAVGRRVALACAEPRDVAVAGAAVERVALVVGRERVQDVVAVAAVFVVGAEAAPDEVAPRAAVQRVVARPAVQPAEPVGAGGERVVSGAAPDDGAAVSGGDAVVAEATEQAVEPPAPN